MKNIQAYFFSRPEINMKNFISSYKQFYIYAFFTLIFSTFSHAAINDIQGGISLGSTRVIYEEKSQGTSIKVINTSEVPFLIQSWVDSYKGPGGWNSVAPLAKDVFIVTPPLFRLDKGENSLLIRRAGGDFPADRESVFTLNVKAIAKTDKPDPNSNFVQLAFVNSIKLFWRPARLEGDAALAYKQIEFKKNGNALEAFNPSPFHITIKSLKVGGVEVKDPDIRMLAPKSTQTWPLPSGASSQVIYKTINDFGGLTPPQTKPLN